MLIRARPRAGPARGFYEAGGERAGAAPRPTAPNSSPCLVCLLRLRKLGLVCVPINLGLAGRTTVALRAGPLASPAGLWPRAAGSRNVATRKSRRCGRRRRSLSGPGKGARRRRPLKAEAPKTDRILGQPGRGGPSGRKASGSTGPSRSASWTTEERSDSYLYTSGTHILPHGAW